MESPHKKTDLTKLGFNLSQVRKDFPILTKKIYGKPLVYLDNAATTHKPHQVIERLFHLFSHEYSNIHRGVHYLSQRATDGYEQARDRVRSFLNAKLTEEIIFLRGTTEAINLVAASYGRAFLKKDDEILLTTMEHHSNIVPWQMLCEQIGSRIIVVPISEQGELLLDQFKGLLSPRTKLVSVTHISNALGTMNPIKKIIKLSHAVGAKVLVDGAQGLPHVPVDVQDLNCDFYACSGHKLYGPNGIGVLYGKKEWLEAMPPYQGGGDMIRRVSFEKTTYNDLPYKFEAGTPNIAGAIGLGAAIDYLRSINWPEALKHEEELLTYGTKKLLELPEIRIIGNSDQKAAAISFVVAGVHAHDVGTILDREGIAIRAGHHCAQPLMDFYKIPGTARASFGIYNTLEDVDVLVEGLKKVITLFK